MLLSIVGTDHDVHFSHIPKQEKIVLFCSFRKLHQFLSIGFCLFVSFTCLSKIFKKIY